MHEEQDIFTLTLIVDGDDTRLLLSASETPAKDDDEASGVLYRDDLPEQFDEIINKIPRFADSIQEEGSEETVTHSVEEFFDLYDLDLPNVIEAGEKILHVDLDSDKEEDEKEGGLGSSDPYDIYRNDEVPDENDALAHIDPREALEEFPSDSAYEDSSF